MNLAEALPLFDNFYMKKSALCIFLFIFSSSIFLVAQNDYQIKPGEVIIIDEEGKIVNSNSRSTSKYNPGIINTSNSSMKESDYNEDGTPKLPGYSPTGNQEVDAQNYKKAKHLFYQNHPSEFKQWQEKYNTPNHPSHVQEIKQEELDKFPKNKQQLILGNPGKYKVIR